MRPYRISESRSREISRICEITESQLADLLAQLRKRPQYASSVEDIALVFKGPLTQEQAEALTGFVAGMARAREKFKSTPSNAMKAIRAGLVNAKWTPDQLAAWEKREPILEGMISTQYVQIAAKASELYFLHSSHLHDIRIVTDARPVFSPDRGEVISYIIKNVLYMTVSDSDENESLLEYPIGMTDMRKLKTEIESAQSKVAVLKRSLEKNVSADVQIYREEEDDA